MINAKYIILRTTSRIIIQHVNPALDNLIPTQYHSKSLKSEALNLAQGIMGGIIIHRHDLVFIILGRKREVHLLHLERERAYEKRPGFFAPITSNFFLYYSSKNSVRSCEITRKRQKMLEQKSSSFQTSHVIFTHKTSKKFKHIAIPSTFSHINYEGL